MQKDYTSRTVGYCQDCRKYSFGSKRKAKNAGKFIAPGTHVSPYPCPFTPGLWHWGHLHSNIVSGRKVRNTHKP